MVKRIKAAINGRQDKNFLIIARTDAKSTLGLAGAIKRAQAYAEAGADAIFPEALYNQEEFEAFRKAIDIPLLANMTEFGKSELLSRQQLIDLGFNLVIYPVSALRSAMGATQRLLETIKTSGSQKPAVECMLTRSDLYELLQYAEFNQFDQSIFNFEVSDQAEPDI